MAFSFRARVLLVVLLACPLPCFAIGQPQYITRSPSAGGLTLAQNGTAAAVYVDPRDDWGVIHAAQELRSDVQRVTGVKPALPREARSLQGNVVLIGTIGRSRVIDRLVRNHAIDVGAIRGQWESTLTQVVDQIGRAHV